MHPRQRNIEVWNPSIKYYSLFSLLYWTIIYRKKIELSLFSAAAAAAGGSVRFQAQILFSVILQNNCCVFFL